MSPLDAPKPSLFPSPLPSSCSLLTSNFWVSILSLRPQKAFYLGHHSSDAKASSPVPKVTRCLSGPCLWGRLPPCSDTHLHSSLFPAPFPKNPCLWPKDPPEGLEPNPKPNPCSKRSSPISQDSMPRSLSKTPLLGKSCSTAPHPFQISTPYLQVFSCFAAHLP